MRSCRRTCTRCIGNARGARPRSSFATSLPIEGIGFVDDLAAFGARYFVCFEAELTEGCSLPADQLSNAEPVIGRPRGGLPSFEIPSVSSSPGTDEICVRCLAESWNAASIRSRKTKSDIICFSQSRNCSGLTSGIASGSASAAASARAAMSPEYVMLQSRPESPYALSPFPEFWPIASVCVIAPFPNRRENNLSASSASIVPIRRQVYLRMNRRELLEEVAAAEGALCNMYRTHPYQTPETPSACT